MTRILLHMDDFWRQKKVLVTGGTGFLGRYLVEELVRRQASVDIVDYRKPNFLLPQARFYQADIRDARQIDSLCKDIEVVFHLAALPSIARGTKEMYRQVNVEGTRNLLEPALKSGVKKFLHVSSSTVYGIPQEFPLKETSPIQPLGKYGMSKLEAENLCREFILKGLSVSIIRPRVIIGAGRIGIFSILFDLVRQNRPVFMLGNGKNVFQFTNVEDMVRACILAAEDPSPGLFNIGSDVVLPVREELSALISHAKSKSSLVGVPAALAKVGLKGLCMFGVSPLIDEQFSIADKDFKLDTAYARKVLNWQPRFSNIESLNQAFDWYAANKNKRQYRTFLGGVVGKFTHSHMGGFQSD